MNYIKRSAIFILCGLLVGFSERINEGPPKVFLPGIVSTGYNERDLTISPDGKEMFYTIQLPRLSFSVIIRRQMKKGKWGVPEVASFSGQYADLEASFSPDGRKIFFVSNRPLIQGDKNKDYDIWYVEKEKGGWGTPVNAGPAVNTKGNEYYPSLTVDGSVYFTAARADGAGEEDIYKSEWRNNEFTTAKNIGGGVNTLMDEYNAFIDPKERYIIYSVEGAIEGYLGKGDICISYRNSDGSWTKARTLGPAINSPQLDYCPFVHKGIFYFTSERVQPFYKTGEKLGFKEVKNKLDGPGDGLGDIYYLPLKSVIANPDNEPS